MKEKLSKHDISTPSNLVHVSGIKASASGFEMINNSSQVDPKIAGNSMYNIFFKQVFIKGSFISLPVDPVLGICIFTPIS